MSTAGVPDGTSDDLISLRARYVHERVKRLRVDGNAQFREPTGALARFVDDPWAPPATDRPPVRAHHHVVIVGGGLGGLVVAAALRDVGITDVQIVDRASDFGGTWYWNRYPGAMCDTESLVYLPLLETTGYVPSQRYVDGEEIRLHLLGIAELLGLRERALLRTAVTGAEWDATESRWIVRTDHGDDLAGQFLVIANGPLSKPKLPGIPGIEEFAGHAFHTSRWDYGYTGGGIHGGLDRLGDQRVGVIGTGATAVQCIPHLAEASGHLHVFQRTPAAVDVRANGPLDPAAVRTAEPGWQRARMRNYSAIIAGEDEPVDLVADGWTEMFREVSIAALARARGLAREITADERANLLAAADLRTMDRIRARVASSIDAPDTVAALQPWYGRWCKRPCFHDEYLSVFNRPNVTLVDTDGRGVDRITRTGVIVGTRSFELDCLVFATGFEVGTAYTSRTGFEVHGLDGRSLGATWADGLRTFHGLQIHGFPNCFVLGANQTGVTPNYTFMATEQARHIAYIVGAVMARGHCVVEATADAEQRWVDEIVRRAAGGSPYAETCTPSFLNGEGRPNDPVGLLASTFGGGPIEFSDLLEAWRAEGSLSGLDLR